MTLSLENEGLDDIMEIDVSDGDFNRIQCCSVVNSYILRILAKTDLNLIEKELREGQGDPGWLRAYLRIIGEKIGRYEDYIESPQTKSRKREEYERKKAALELLRDKIDIVLKNSEPPDDIKDV